ncbi:hypothetical protein ACWD26_00545 [Streptomyces sp. NPDC002787]
MAGAFSAQAPPGLRTAHIRTMLGTPDHVVAQVYAGLYTDPGAVGARPRSEDRTIRLIHAWATGEPPVTR